MQRLITSLLASILLATSPVAAQTPVDLARQAVDTGDFATLETMLDEQTKRAREARDFVDLRGLYETLFATANSRRLAQEEAWLEQFPGSPYAATALGWSHMRLSQLARGEATVHHTSREAMEAHREERAKVLEMADRALSADPNFVPALDLALVLARYSSGQFAVPTLVERTLKASPDMRALTLGLTALSPRWGGSIEEQFALCDTAKAQLPQLDDDICLIYLAFYEDLGKDARKRALEALDRHDEPFLDFARRYAYRIEWRGRPEAAETSMRLFMKRVQPGAAFDRLHSDMRVIARIFADPFFQIEAEEALVAAMRETLIDSPEDYGILRELLIGIFDDATPGAAPDRAEEARALWRAMLIRGSTHADVWAAGGRLQGYLGNWAKPAVTGPYAINNVYYSNYDSNSLRAYLVNLFELHEMAARPESLPPGTTPDDLRDEVVLCPMFRVQRLFETVCTASPRDGGCKTTGWGSSASGEVRRLMARTEACAWERTAPIEDLLFQPVPLSQFHGDDE